MKAFMVICMQTAKKEKQQKKMGKMKKLDKMLKAPYSWT